MSNLLYIVRTFTLLARHKPWKLSLVFLLTLFLGMSSGFSVMLLIPLLQVLNIGGEMSDDRIARFFSNLAGRTGIGISLELILGVFLSLMVLTALVQYWSSILKGNYQRTFIYELRRRLFRKIILADWSLLNNKSSNNHVQVLTREVPGVISFLYYYLNLFSTFIFTASYTAYAIVISAKFTQALILTGGLLFFILRIFLYRSYILAKGFAESYSRLLKYIGDFWQTVKIAKVHSSEKLYYDKFDEANTTMLDLEFRMLKNFSIPQLISQIGGILVLIAVIYAGYRLKLMPLTSFFILIILFSRIYPQITSINNIVNMMLSNLPSVKLVTQLDEDFPDADFDRSADRGALPLNGEIILTRVSFAYPGGEQLFAGFSETIPARKITGIVGESGRGKTTLIDLIAGLQRPGSGEIRVDGILLDDETLPHWRSSIGYLPQDSFFIDGTLRENLVWDTAHVIPDEEIMEMLRRVNAAQLAERLPEGLDTPVMNYAYHFSGGERQRLALARVLFRRPRLLLLDEATSSLDAENERQVMEVIAALKESVTIVFVTHRASLLPWFDKVIRI